MSRLRVEPRSVVKTVPDLHALSRGLARQAIALYDALAARMAEFGNDAAQAAFERVAAIQRDQGGDDGPVAGDLPAVFQDEGLRDLRLVTAYRAFALAVRNEEHAFAFWSYISAHATIPAVKEEAERLALEEMDHVKVLRAERRRVYQDSRDPEFERLRTASLAELRAEAARRETALAHLHERIAEALSVAGDDLAPTLAAIAREEREGASALGGAKAAQSDDAPLPDDARALRALAIEQIDVAAEVYLFAADWSDREDVIAEAQDLANRALRRLERLR